MYKTENYHQRLSEFCSQSRHMVVAGPGPDGEPQHIPGRAQDKQHKQQTNSCRPKTAPTALLLWLDPGSSRTASVIRYQCKEGRMKTLFLLVLSCKFITVWMTNKELGCRRALDEGWEPITNVTWYCDQENGKLTCKNSLNFECNTSIKPFERNVTTDQESVLGLEHAGAIILSLFAKTIAKLCHQKHLFSSLSDPKISH